MHYNVYKLEYFIYCLLAETVGQEDVFAVIGPINLWFCLLQTEMWLAGYNLDPSCMYIKLQIPERFNILLRNNMYYVTCDR